VNSGSGVEGGVDAVGADAWDRSDEFRPPDDVLGLAGVNSALPPLRLLHVGWRWYDPSLGRFVQRDPIGLAGGLNVYVYCRAVPSARVDATGTTSVADPWSWEEFGEWVVGGAGAGALEGLLGAGPAGVLPGALKGAGLGAAGYICVSVTRCLRSNPGAFVPRLPDDDHGGFWVPPLGPGGPPTWFGPDGVARVPGVNWD